MKTFLAFILTTIAFAGSPSKPFELVFDYGLRIGLNTPIDLK